MNVAHQLLDFQSHFYTEGHFRPQPVRAIRVSGGGLELIEHKSLAIVYMRTCLTGDVTVNLAEEDC